MMNDNSQENLAQQQAAARSSMKLVLSVLFWGFVGLVLLFAFLGFMGGALQHAAANHRPA